MSRKAESKYEISKPDLMWHLDRLGMSAMQASEEMGFNQNYLAVCFQRGNMPKYAVRLIKARFGIDYEQYKKHEEPKVEEKNETVESGDGYTQDLILEELRAIRSMLQTITEALV